MFVEKNRYREAPRLWISYCYEKLGNLDKAKEWAEGNPKRERELSKRTYVIEVHRPGALGDVLCTTPALRELRKKYPEAHIRYVTHESSRPILVCNPDVDEVVESNDGKYADQIINFAYPMNEGYPYSPMTRHLTQYFAENAQVELSSDQPVLNLLPDDVVVLEHQKPVITFAVKTGWSEYKEWPLERWEELIQLFPEYQFIQLGAPGEPLVEGAQHLCGKLTLRESFSVLQQSDLFIGLDSSFNHVTRALDVPAVIMFGSTSPIGSGYDTNTNLWSDYECSPCYRENNAISVHPMPPCPHDHKCMVDYMTVERVANAVSEKLNVEKPKKRMLPTVS
jgi:ADP-heptose:LPS heptosyltransferase